MPASWPVNENFILLVTESVHLHNQPSSINYYGTDKRDEHRKRKKTL